MTFPTMRAALATLMLLAVSAPMAAQAEPKAKQPKPRRQLRYNLNGAKNVKKMDINSATRKDLMTLPGVTEAYADAIIKGRPYLSKAKLASKDVVPMNVYQGISGLIEARQGTPAK